MRPRKQLPPAKGLVWLITYSDLMTLLMTFFVLLTSMSVIDERSKRAVASSVASKFGSASTINNPLAPAQPAELIEPGPMENENIEDLEPLKDMLFEDASKDLQFQENRYVQIFSISDEVLFASGGTELGPKGKELLGRLLPYLQRIEYPLLVAGHTANRRDEEGKDYTIALDKAKADATWMLSYRRAIAVYRFLTEHGIEAKRLSLEAFGQYHPRFSENTPEGRKKNRRVDLVLDKRNKSLVESVEKLRERDSGIPQEHLFKGFKFELDMPGTTSRGQQPAERTP